jgi:glycosyltransferase involved in cell wall biosynthesis
MRVGLNLVFLVPGETGGMEVYARELIPRLAAIDGIEPIAFVNREAASGEPGPWHEIPHETVPVNARSRVQWVRGEQQLLPRLAARAGCDLVHSLASTAPLWGDFKRVTTVHDLNYKLVPDAHFGLLRLGMGVLVPAAARRSDRVIAISRSTAEDIERHLGLAPDRVDVVPQGVVEPGGTAPTPADRLRAEHGLGDLPILLSVSAKRPHKNLLRLIEAHAMIDSARRPMLVLPGYATPYESELIARAASLGTTDRVRFLHWLSDADLEGLYAAADAFVFPSLYEGFGLPLLEAMARGLPVACSDRSSLPEVAGEAALLFDPEDVGAIHTALTRLLDDDPLRAELRAAGERRVREFDWDRTAAGTVASYERALAARAA